MLSLLSRFSTPSPFPARAKRSRSVASATTACFGASPPSTQPCWTDFQSRTAAGASLSPVTAFPRLNEDAAEADAASPPRAAPRAQRDLFGSLAPAVAAPDEAPGAGALPAPGAAPKPRSGVVDFGELVAEGLALQQAEVLGKYPSCDPYAYSSTGQDPHYPT